MKTNTLMVFAILLLLIPVSCVERYWPDLGDKYDKALVVDGFISNEPGPYTITLSLSSSMEQSRFSPYPGCQVSIISEEGPEEILTEDTPGKYISNVNGMQGEVGKKYKVRILTPDEKTYESDFDELKAPVYLDSIYAEIEYHQSEDLDHVLEGYQLYLDTKMAESDTNYLLWRFESTYKYQSDFLIRYVYNNRRLSVFPQPDSFYTCWRSETTPEIVTYETAQLSAPVLKRLPLYYISTEGRELSMRYSLNVKQLTLSAPAYKYWNRLQVQNENQGALYNIQPYQILGNIKNMHSPEEPVMGYFFAAGISERRIYLNRPNLNFYYYVCRITEAEYEAFKFIGFTGSFEWPLYVTTDSDWKAALTDQRCVDCRKKGGRIVKPDFWED